MSAARTAGVVVVGILLTATLFTGNVVFAAHQTVLDPGYVSTTLEEEGGYEQLAEQGLANAAPDGEFDAGPLGLNQTAFMDDVVTEEYVASQAESNIDRLYAYLHGNADELNLSIETAPLAANAGAAAESQVAERDPGDLAADAFGENGFGENVPITAEAVRSLDDSRSSYEAAKADFRERVRDRVVDEMVDAAFADASNDELLSVVVEDYDPRDYTEAEKERMVADRESEIRTALERRITEERSDDVDDQVGTALEESNAELGGDVSLGDEANDEMVAAATDLQTTVVDAFTTDMGYDTYREDSTAARDDLAAAVGTMVETRITEELGDSASISDDMTAEQREPIDAAATQVQRLDLLAVVLPILALVFVGLVGFISRSAGRTGGTLGWAMLLSGLPTLIGAGAINTLVANEMASTGTEGPMADIVLGLFDGFVGTLQTQSILLAVLGTLLVAVALALKFELIDR